MIVYLTNNNPINLLYRSCHFNNDQNRNIKFVRKYNRSSCQIDTKNLCKANLL